MVSIAGSLDDLHPMKPLGDTPQTLQEALQKMAMAKTRLSSFDSSAFQKLRGQILKEGAAFSVLQAYDVVKEMTTASSEVCACYEKECRLGLTRMPASQQSLLWDLLASQLGFSLDKKGLWYSNNVILHLLRLNDVIPKAITSNAADQTRAFLISGYHAQDSYFSLSAKFAGKILCAAVAHKKAALPEILEDHLSVLFSGHGFDWNEYQTIVRTMQSVIPNSWGLPAETKPQDIAVPVSFVERINEAMLYGTGNPPSFDLRSTLGGLVSKLNSANLIEEPACRPNEKAFSPVAAIHPLKVGA